jgi:hypothetical protein
MTERRKQDAMRNAMRAARRNVVPLKPPLDCTKLAAQLREIILGNASEAERVAFERELRGLRSGQRAMIAARTANCKRGHGHRLGEHNNVDHFVEPNYITVSQAAKATDVSPSAVVDARQVLRRGTPTEIRTIEQGERGSGARMIADQLRQNLTVAQRRRIAEIPLGERGRAPGNRQNARLKALVWRQLCNALQAAQLPRLEDVVEIARSHDRTGLIDRDLLRAHERLGELIELWTRPILSKGSSA